jgi:hypothetical protein
MHTKCLLITGYFLPNSNWVLAISSAESCSFFFLKVLLRGLEQALTKIPSVSGQVGTSFKVAAELFLFVSYI